MANNLKVNTKVNKFHRRSTPLIIRNLKVNIIVNAPEAPNGGEKKYGVRKPRNRHHGGRGEGICQPKCQL
jgi:hypothetical protein